MSSAVTGRRREIGGWVKIIEFIKKCRNICFTVVFKSSEILPKIWVPQKCARSQFGKLASREYVTQTITIDSICSA